MTDVTFRDPVCSFPGGREEESTVGHREGTVTSATRRLRSPSGAPRSSMTRQRERHRDERARALQRILLGAVDLGG